MTYAEQLARRITGEEWWSTAIPAYRQMAIGNAEDILGHIRALAERGGPKLLAREPTDKMVSAAKEKRERLDLKTGMLDLDAIKVRADDCAAWKDEEDVPWLAETVLALVAEVRRLQALCDAKQNLTAVAVAANKQRDALRERVHKLVQDLVEELAHGDL